MTATRLAQAGAEINSIAEFPAEVTSGATSVSATISSVQAKTGTYALRFLGTSHSRGLTIPSTTQIRGGFYIYHAGLSGSGSTIKAVVLLLTPSGGTSHWLQWTGATNLLELFVNGVSVATVSAAIAGFSSTAAWKHLGFTFKAHASTGYFTIYVDGVAVLTYTGNTTNVNGILSVCCGGGVASGSASWATALFVDDMYVDDDSGGTDVAPSSPRFLWSLANGAGTTTQWTPLSSTNISNVDDTDGSAPDDDSTYNSASAAGLTDTFATTNITVPVGLQIAAAIPVAWAKKTNAGVASTLSLVAYNGSTTTGSAKTPTTTYGPVSDRFVTDPSSAAWTQTSFNAAEFGVTSAGSY